MRKRKQQFTTANIAINVPAIYNNEKPTGTDVEV